MKLCASGEDYLEAILMLQKTKVWFVPLILPDIWGSPNRVLATQ